MSAPQRAEVRRLLLRARREADACISAITTADPLRYDFLHEQLYRYVLAKFLLTDGDRPADDSFHALVETSLSRSMGISPDLVKEFDTARSCDGATSAMAKKVLLFMAIQQALHIELPARESAQIKTMGDLSALVWETLGLDPQWSAKLEQ